MDSTPPDSFTVAPPQLASPNRPPGLNMTNFSHGLRAGGSRSGTRPAAARANITTQGVNTLNDSIMVMANSAGTGSTPEEEELAQAPSPPSAPASPVQAGVRPRRRRRGFRTHPSLSRYQREEGPWTGLGRTSEQVRLENIRNFLTQFNERTKVAGTAPGTQENEGEDEF